nr:thioredoxin H4 [Solanum lycopersicum]
MSGYNYPTWPEFNKKPITQQIKRCQVITFNSSTKCMIHLNFLKDTNKLVVIDFTATWCGPCRNMDPIINDFAAKYTNVEFVKIDVDELVDVAEKYGVQAMPTFVLMKKGEVVDQIVGADKDGLKMKIEKHKGSLY